MPKLRALSGQDVLKIFARFGFERIDQEGSHVKVRRRHWLAAGSLSQPLCTTRSIKELSEPSSARPCGIFRNPTFIRISTATTSENWWCEEA